MNADLSQYSDGQIVASWRAVNRRAVERRIAGNPSRSCAKLDAVLLPELVERMGADRAATFIQWHTKHVAADWN